MKRNKKAATVKEPSLLRQIISIYYERAKRQKAIRLLEKQTWGLDFLSLVVQKAARNNETLSIIVTNKDGMKMEITGKTVEKIDKNFDDNIFNHLDDDIAVWKYIREHARK